MKIAISSSGKTLESQIDPRFGRCAYFIICNTEDMNFEAYDNENLALGGGAGIQSAQFVASKGVEALITGNCGPNATQTISAAGIKLYVGQSGSVKDAIERIKANQIDTTTEANVPSHFGTTNQTGASEPLEGNGGNNNMSNDIGTGQGMSTGRGMGQGMGAGRGMGRGMGGGGGMGRRAAGGNVQGPISPATPSKEEEVINLKKLSEELNRQMLDIQEKIKKFENSI